MNKLTEWVGKAVILRWSIVGIIVVAAMAWGYMIVISNVKSESKLAVYGMPNENGSDHTISEFSLISQDGKTVTQKNFKDKIYVADFFFATCEGICPRMSEQMERVAERFKDNPDVLLLSHTSKPEEDSVPVLKQYANDHHADPAKWYFVTGPRSEINKLAFKSYMLGGEEGRDSSEFVHTQYFALVDAQRRIRGFYDGTDSLEVNKLMSEIEILLQEEK